MLEISYELLFLLGWTCIVSAGTWWITERTIVTQTIDHLLFGLESDGIIKIVEHSDGELEVKKAD